MNPARYIYRVWLVIEIIIWLDIDGAVRYLRMISTAWRAGDEIRDSSNSEKARPAQQPGGYG